jgi:hypothetical protein
MGKPTVARVPARTVLLKADKVEQDLSSLERAINRIEAARYLIDALGRGDLGFLREDDDLALDIEFMCLDEIERRVEEATSTLADLREAAKAVA